MSRSNPHPTSVKITSARYRTATPKASHQPIKTQPTMAVSSNDPKASPNIKLQKKYSHIHFNASFGLGKGGFSEKGEGLRMRE
jgi:hypothetical protein